MEDHYFDFELDEAPSAPPAWVQLGMFVLDASGSMLDPASDGESGTKAGAVNAAVRSLLTRFKAGRKRDNFAFGVVDFHHAVSHTMAPEPAATIDDYGDYDPTSNGSGGTFIGCGLEEAKRLGDTWLAAQDPSLQPTVVLLVLSDGECGNPDQTRAAAAAIKADSRYTVACALFSSLDHQAPGGPLLQQICSDAGTFYKEIYDAATLREFFKQSLTKASVVAGHIARNERLL